MGANVLRYLGKDIDVWLNTIQGAMGQGGVGRGRVRWGGVGRDRVG